MLNMLVVCLGLLAALAPAVPRDAAAVIADAFRSHDIVAIPEAHGSGAIHAFNMSLLRDPRVQAVVDVIVVEFGNSRYQDILDRFERGEDVPDESVRQVWRNTTLATAGADAPAYEEFFRAVRTVNASRPAAHRIRVLAGDPPIDWDNVHTPEEYEKWIGMRETFPADLIRKEVISKHRHALLIYGQMHFQRKNILTNYDMSSEMAQSIVSLLERDSAAKVFTVWGADVAKVQADSANWPTPTIAVIRGTVLGAVDFAEAYTSPRLRFVVRDGKPERLPQEQWRKLPAEEQLDAVLHLGGASPADAAKMDLPRALCADPAYMAMRLGRIALIGPAGQEQAERLKEYCK